MNLLSVRCNHCGAPLEVAESARYVTCQFCNSQLSVQRTGTAVSTEVLGELVQNTERMAENLEIIRIQNDITALDREWEMEREKYMRRGENGKLIEPSEGPLATGFGIFFGCAVLGLGLIWMSLSSPIGMGALSLFGLIPVAIGIGTIAIYLFTKETNYRPLRERYLARRLVLKNELLAARNATS